MPDLDAIHYKFFPKAKTAPYGKTLIKFAWIVEIIVATVGLAIAYELSRKNNDVLILETEDEFGKITSSRNSGVIHAGIYYPENSLKSKFCVLGNRLLYDYCKKNFIPYLNTKKLLVASLIKRR